MMMTAYLGLGFPFRHYNVDTQLSTESSKTQKSNKFEAVERATSPLLFEGETT
jgi:hypothetical protein